MRAQETQTRSIKMALNQDSERRDHENSLSLPLVSTQYRAENHAQHHKSYPLVGA